MSPTCQLTAAHLNITSPTLPASVPVLPASKDVLHNDVFIGNRLSPVDRLTLHEKVNKKNNWTERRQALNNNDIYGTMINDENVAGSSESDMGDTRSPPDIDVSWIFFYWFAELRFFSGYASPLVINSFEQFCIDRKIAQR